MGDGDAFSGPRCYRWRLVGIEESGKIFDDASGQTAGARKQPRDWLGQFSRFFGGIEFGPQIGGRFIKCGDFRRFKRARFCLLCGVPVERFAKPRVIGVGMRGEIRALALARQAEITLEKGSYGGKMLIAFFGRGRLERTACAGARHQREHQQCRR